MNQGSYCCIFSMLSVVFFVVWIISYAKGAMSDDRPTARLVKGQDHYCSACQAKNPPLAKYCRGCGAKLVRDEEGA